MKKSVIVRMLAMILIIALVLTGCGNDDSRRSKKDKDKNPTEAPEDPGQNTDPGVQDANLWSTNGTVLRTDGKTYFIKYHEVKSEVYDTIQICVIDDSEGATAKEIYSEPAVAKNEDGDAFYKRIFYLTAYGDNLFYLLENRYDNSVTACWVSKDGSKSGTLGTVEGRLRYDATPCVSGDRFYFGYFTNPDGGEIGEDSVLKESYIDLKEKTMAAFKPEIDPEDAKAAIVYVDGYQVYYNKYQKYMDTPDGIYCFDMKKKSTTEVVTNIPEDTELLTFYGKYLIYENDDIIYSVDISDGKTYKIAEDISDSSFQSGAMTVYGDTVYYFKDDVDLYSCSLTGENEKLLVKDADDEREKWCLGVSGDWFYFMDDEAVTFYRMKLDATSFPAEEDCIRMSGEDAKPENPKPEDPKPEDPKPEEPEVPEEQASAEAVANAFAKYVIAHDSESAMKLVETCAFPAYKLASELGMPMEEVLPFVKNLDLGCVELEKKYPQIVNALREHGYTYDDELCLSWINAVSAIKEVTRNWINYAISEVTLELEMVEDSSLFIPTDKGTSYMVDLYGAISRQEHRGYLGIDKLNGAYTIFYVAKYNQWPDFDAVWLPKNKQPAEKKYLWLDDDGMFFIDFSLLGMEYNDLNKLLGGNLPTPEVWEWGTYTSFFDYNYKGLPCTFFLCSDYVYGIRYEFQSSFGNINQDLYSLAKYNYYYLYNRSDEYGQEIPKGEQNFGYHFKTLNHNVNFDLFYNYYDDIPHNAMHYEYIPDQCY